MANRCDWFVLVKEIADEMHGRLVGAHNVRVLDAAGDNECVKFISRNIVDRFMYRDLSTILAFNFAYGGISLLFAIALHLVPGSSPQERVAHAFGLVPLWLLLTCGILLLAFRKHRKQLLAPRC